MLLKLWNGNDHGSYGLRHRFSFLFLLCSVERVLPGKQAVQTPACSADRGRGAEQPACSLRFSCNLTCLVRFVFSNYFLVCFDRRLEPTEKPLQIVYDYLAGLGFDDPVRMQEEAANSDLSCMIRFYSGKKLCVCALAAPVA